MFKPLNQCLFVCLFVVVVFCSHVTLNLGINVPGSKQQKLTILKTTECNKLKSSYLV